MVFMTGAMSFEEASAWAFANSPYMGKNTPWGIITKNEGDARHMAMNLAMLDPTTTHAVVCLYYHSPNQKQNPHYHLHNYIFNGKHKHFHVWYGLGG